VLLGLLQQNGVHCYIVEQRGLQIEKKKLNKLDVRYCMSGVMKEVVLYHEIIYYVDVYDCK